MGTSKKDRDDAELKFVEKELDILESIEVGGCESVEVKKIIIQLEAYKKRLLDEKEGH